MIIPHPGIFPMRFAGKQPHGTPESFAYAECLKKLEPWARRKGFTSTVPDSWLTKEKELINEHFYKYTVIVAPPPMVLSYWVNGKRYEAPTLFDPRKLESFIGYHPGDGFPVLKGVL